jgi:surface antigen
MTKRPVWNFRIAAMVLAVVLLVSGCANMNRAQSGALMGTLAGAAAGGLIGHNWTGALIGAGVGLALGYMIGNEWDKYDQQQLSKSLEQGRSGTQSSWRNPDTGKQYAATPQPAYQQEGQTYRDVQIETVNPDGSKQTVQAKAVRDPSGAWRLVQ